MTLEYLNRWLKWQMTGRNGRSVVSLTMKTSMVPHYWVQWSPTLVSESEMGRARALVARYKARLRPQHKQKGGKGRGRLLPSKAGKEAAAGVRATGQTQEKKRRGRPRKRA